MSEKIVTFSDYGAKAALQLSNEQYLLNQDFTQPEKELISKITKENFLLAKNENESLIETLSEKNVLKVGYRQETIVYQLLKNLKKEIISNPVYSVKLIKIEFTTVCNISCKACFYTYIPRITETKLENLINAIDEAKRMGVPYYLFTGGEISKYGKNWLNIVKHVSATGHHAGFITNGWWGISDKIKTSDGEYNGVTEYVQILKEAGIQRIMFSLDGLEQEHDEYRKSPGLFKKVVRAVHESRKAGIIPMVSITLHPGIKDRELFFSEITELFQLDEDINELIHHKEKTLETRMRIEEVIDIGGGARYLKDKTKAKYSINDLAALNNFCKGYTHSNKLDFRANGDVQPCSIASLGRDFGNIHQQRFSEIVNNMRKSKAYELLKFNKFQEVMPYYDKNIFGEKFHSRCALIGILGSLLTGIEELKMKNNLTADNIYKLNLKIAKETGYSTNKQRDKMR